MNLVIPIEEISRDEARRRYPRRYPDGEVTITAKHPAPLFVARETLDSLQASLDAVARADGVNLNGADVCVMGNPKGSPFDWLQSDHGFTYNGGQSYAEWNTQYGLRNRETATPGVSVGMPWMPVWMTAILVAMVALNEHKDAEVTRREFITLGRGS